MKKFFPNIQNDSNLSKNYTSSTNGNDRQALMLKMMTSYSIFLFIILVLFVHLYISDTKNARSRTSGRSNRR